MDDGKLTVGSLFSGIDGIVLGLERTGRFRGIWACEIEDYPSAILAERFPRCPNLGDITKVDWNAVERPNVIVGGFPCQNLSVAGKRAGLHKGEKSGLWREYARCLRALRPKYAIVENVSGLLGKFEFSRRYGKDGNDRGKNRRKVVRDFYQGIAPVLGDLSELGYRVEYDSITAAEVGAPHRRLRYFLVASLSDVQRRAELDALCERGTETQRTTESVIAHAERRRNEALGQARGRQPDAKGRVVADSDCGNVQAHGERGVCEEVSVAGQGEPAESITGRITTDSDSIRHVHGQPGELAAESGEQAQRESVAGVSSDSDGFGRGTGRGNREGDEVLEVEKRELAENKRYGLGRLDRIVAGVDADATDPHGYGMDGNGQESFPGFPEFQRFQDVRRIEDLRNRPGIPEPIVLRSNYGLPAELDAFIENEFERIYRGMDCDARKVQKAKKTFKRHLWEQRIKALGNAVVPACAFVAAQRIIEMEWMGE